MVSENEDNERTTIVLTKATKNKMDAVKVHSRETYEDIILRLIGGVL